GRRLVSLAARGGGGARRRGRRGRRDPAPGLIGSHALGLPAARRSSIDPRMASDRQERAAVRAAQAGSAKALESLYRDHWPRAYRAAYLVVHDAAGAEDIAQEAFLAAVRNLDRFDRSRPFGPW